MNKTLKEYSEKMAKELLVALSKDKGFNEINKDLADQNGEFEVVASMATPDRIGDVVLADAWDFKNYKKNPTILWGHDYSIPAIGKATSWVIEGDKLIIKGIFASNDFAQQIRKDYEGGFHKAVSVGFISKKRNDEDFDIIENAELLELSFVGVGMHADAVDNLKKSIGDIAVKHMIDKGIIKDVDAEPETPAETDPVDPELAPVEVEVPTGNNVEADPKPAPTEPETETDEEKKFQDAVAKAVEIALAKKDAEENPEVDPEPTPEPVENEEDEEKPVEEMNDEEKAIFMHDLEKVLKKTVGVAQEALRDVKRENQK